MHADIALLTDQRYTATHAEPGDWYLANILKDDQLLSEALANYGLTAKRVDWADPTLDLRQFRAAVFRTTWDYFERADEFHAWLTRCENHTQWINTKVVLPKNAAMCTARRWPRVSDAFAWRSSSTIMRTFLAVSSSPVCGLA